MYTLHKIVYKAISLASRIMRVCARTHVRVRRVHSGWVNVGKGGTKGRKREGN